jgi:intracellular septation protein
LLTAFMVIFFGGLTVYFNDERFFKMKTTIIYGMFATILGIGLLRGQSWLEYVMDGMMPLKHEGWMILTRRLTGLFAILAVGNEIVWRTMSTDAWVKIETFGFPALMFAFFMAQAPLLTRYSDEEPEDQA